VNVAVYFAQILKIFAKTMVNFSALVMRPHPHAVRLRGAQCKTWARGPFEKWYYDVIVFSRPCYDSGRAQMYSAALTRELSTFANDREEIC